jgi:hypothetical protein
MIFARGTNLFPQARQMLVLALLAALALAPVAQAQTAASNQPAGTNGAWNEGNVELPSQAHGKFDPVRFMNAFSTHIILHRDLPAETQFAFFPPVAPPLESEIPMLAPFDSGPPAPEELAAFVGDIFYPLLGARLASGDLPRPLRAQIVAYRYAKVGLQDELRSRVLVLKDVDPESRRRQLVDFAALQAPRISELEAMAEKLRVDLRPARAFGIPVDSTDMSESLARRVRAVRDTPSDPAALARQAEAIRGAAFYQEGLSLGQRSLLLEAAIELDGMVNPTAAANRVAPGKRLLYFSPEGSRIPIPEDLPAPLANKVNEYVSSKNALKAELRDALQGVDDASGDARREAMVKLAFAHAPRIARFEALAEEIRGGLAALPNPPGPPAPPSLPPDLTARISDYRRHKLELLKTLRAMLDARFPTADTGHAPQKARPVDAGSGTLAWMHDGTSTTEIQPADLRVSVAEFDHRQNELITALNIEEAGIRESLAAYVRSANGPLDRKSVNDLLRDFEDGRERKEIWERYRDYQTAVLLPGLSAGQRRLIFDSAVERLALPLPAGKRAN